MIRRDITPKLKELAKGFPVLSLTGPRQSGKTTLVREVFPDYTYLNLENLDVMAAATEDPRRFLETHRKKGAIIDEAQRSPELFSYLQGIVDESGLMGRYVLTGSQNFLLLEKITQSLAGRTAILHLLPFSSAELKSAEVCADDLVPSFTGEATRPFSTGRSSRKIFTPPTSRPTWSAICAP